MRTPRPPPPPSPSQSKLLQELSQVQEDFFSSFGYTPPLGASAATSARSAPGSSSAAAALGFGTIGSSAISATRPRPPPNAATASSYNSTDGGRSPRWGGSSFRDGDRGRSPLRRRDRSPLRRRDLVGVGEGGEGGARRSPSPSTLGGRAGMGVEARTGSPVGGRHSGGGRHVSARSDVAKSGSARKCEFCNGEIIKNRDKITNHGKTTNCGVRNGEKIINGGVRSREGMRDAGVRDGGVGQGSAPDGVSFAFPSSSSSPRKVSPRLWRSLSPTASESSPSRLGWSRGTGGAAR